MGDDCMDTLKKKMLKWTKVNSKTKVDGPPAAAPTLTAGGSSKDIIENAAAPSNTKTETTKGKEAQENMSQAVVQERGDSKKLRQAELLKDRNSQIPKWTKANSKSKTKVDAEALGIRIRESTKEIAEIVSEPLERNTGKDPQSLTQSLQERIDTKRLRHAELLAERTNFRTLLAEREHVLHTQAIELESRKEKLKVAAGSLKAQDEKIQKLETEKAKAATLKQSAEDETALFEREIAELRNKISKLNAVQALKVERVKGDLERQRELDELKGVRAKHQQEAILKAECDVKEAAYAAMRDLVASDPDIEKDKPRRHRRKRTRRGTQYNFNPNASDASNSESAEVIVLKAPPTAAVPIELS